MTVATGHPDDATLTKAASATTFDPADWRYRTPPQLRRPLFTTEAVISLIPEPYQNEAAAASSMGGGMY